MQNGKSVEEGASAEEAPSFNVAVVRGACSSPPEVRVLPSEQRLAQLQVTTRVDGGRCRCRCRCSIRPPGSRSSTPATRSSCSARCAGASSGPGASTASRVEIEAEVVCRARDRRRSRGLRRRVEELLEALDA